MDESKFNTILKNAFHNDGFAYKIPDPLVRQIQDKKGKPLTITSPARPFDGFAFTSQGVICWEAKFMKGYQSFAYSRITDNQLTALSVIDKVTAKYLYGSDPICFCLIILGIWEPRQGVDIFPIEINSILCDLEKGKKSIPKAELLDLKARGFYMHMPPNTRDYNMDVSFFLRCRS